MRKVHEKVKPVPVPRSVDQFAIKFMFAITSAAAAAAVTNYSQKVMDHGFMTSETS